MILTSNVAIGTKEGGKFLQAGIHNATFKGIEEQEIQGKDGSSYTTMAIIFEVDGFGEYVHRLFEPTSNERVAGQWGDNPSQVEQFFVTIRHLIETANPKAFNDLETKAVEIKGNFKQVIAQIQKFTNGFINKQTQIKLLPQRSGFNQLPGFPARINRAGVLYLTTRFIGNNLTLTANEITAIEKAKSARPTNMQTQDNQGGVMDGMSADFRSSQEIDDLPF